MSFADYFRAFDIESLREVCQNVSKDDVRRLLAKQAWQLADLPALISPAASEFLEPMAVVSKQLTEQRFGRTVNLFVPLYLSNECYNRCTYCGFSMDLDYARKTLTDDELRQEAKVLLDKGFRHILLLTGEAPDKAGVEYLDRMVRILKPDFASIGLEVQPLKTESYERLIAAGVTSLTVFQETYHRDSYMIFHLSGKKSRFDFRLETADRAGEAGFSRINLGALLGLYDWRYEALALGQHVAYLKKKYWRSQIGISVPRIQKVAGGFTAPYPVSDAALVQYILAFRLVFPDLLISLSTRESARFRDQLVPLGITEMSAESSTEPGGYSGQETGEQFEISDDRSLQDVCGMLQQKGYDPLIKDWSQVITRP